MSGLEALGMIGCRASWFLLPKNEIVCPKHITDSRFSSELGFLPVEPLQNLITFCKEPERKSTTQP